MAKPAKSLDLSLYGGSDPADLPRYTRLDASRATGVPASTIGVWVHGMAHTTRKGLRARYAPVVSLPVRTDPRLSFNNLLEVNVLRALRGVHEVRLKSVREAIENAKREHGIDRLLIHPKLRTSGGALFLDFYFRLVDLSNSQQLAMRDILKNSLKRVELDDKARPSFFPVPRYMDRGERPILVSPYISFGDAVLGRRGITTHVIRSRFDAGETKEDIIADYDLHEDEFQEAILYETAA